METPEEIFQLWGKAHGTDKVTYHGYHRFYPRFLHHLRDKEMGMIEIGIEYGHSLNLWLSYFPKAFIYGVDIKVSKSGERFLIHQADQSKVDQLQVLAEIIKKNQHKIMFINDDGSHVPEHMIITFNYFFKEVLEEGGTYAIEDIETCYWKDGSLYGYHVKCGVHHKKSVIEIFKKVVEDINSEYLLPEEKQYQSALVKEIPDDVRKMISTVTFAQNCIIITKKTKEEYQYDNRPYKWPTNLQLK